MLLVVDCCGYGELFFFFFFKQKTAYEIVSRDWSSDVCSSDLTTNHERHTCDHGNSKLPNDWQEMRLPDAITLKEPDRKSVV